MTLNVNLLRQLTSSSLYQDRDSAVRTNQYSLAPPFMIPMLLMVSQPFLMTLDTHRNKSGVTKLAHASSRYKKTKKKRPKKIPLTKHWYVVSLPLVDIGGNCHWQHRKRGVTLTYVNKTHFSLHSFLSLFLALFLFLSLFRTLSIKQGARTHTGQDCWGYLP